MSLNLKYTCANIGHFGWEIQLLDIPSLILTPEHISPSHTCKQVEIFLFLFSFLLSCFSFSSSYHKLPCPNPSLSLCFSHPMFVIFRRLNPKLERGQVPNFSINLMYWCKNEFCSNKSQISLFIIAYVNNNTHNTI